MGVNEDFNVALQKGVEARQAHLSVLRENAIATVEIIALDPRLATSESEIDSVLREQLARFPSVVAVRFKSTAGSKYTSSREVDFETIQVLTETRQLKNGTLEVDVKADRLLFQSLEDAGESADLYSRLLSRTDYISGVLLWVYFGLLFVVTLAAFAAGVLLSRRVTQRVSLLSDATKRVGAGDLTVEVQTDSKDEVGELTRAFNSMVSDLRESRTRIDYLQRISAWQQFARRLAHEIKNPLTPIQLAVQEAQSAYKGEDKKFAQTLMDAREIVEEEVATLRELVSEFSAFAKLPTPVRAQTTLGELGSECKRAIEMAIADVKRTRDVEIDLRSSVEDSDHEVLVDARMLRRCVDNLARNAAQAIGDADGEGIISLRVAQLKGGFILSLEDNGPGIPEADQSNVFDPYHTTKSDGTGLGLAIVKKVILEHQGDITCSKSELGGAKFLISISHVQG